MRKLFNYEGPFISVLTKIGDFIAINFLILVFSIPIVTIGASLTAGHYTMLKHVRGESYIFSHFWKSFRENFKQSTIIWIGMLVYLVVAIGSFFLLVDGSAEKAFIVQGVILAAIVLCVALMLWIFPLQSKFVNKIGQTFRLAFILTFKHLFRTILMLVVSVLPFLINAEWFTLVLLFGVSFPMYLCALIYNKVFEKLEIIVLEGKNEEVSEIV